MKYFIGIDGGGTKTAFVCYNEENTLIGECILPSCHVLQVDTDCAVLTLKNGVKNMVEAIPEKNAQIYICAGLAGYGQNMKLRKQIEKVCSLSFAAYPYLIKSDAEIALAGALNGQDGILVIVGTGSIALSKNQDKISRCGGWGYMLGDEASAYDMAKQLLSAYTMQCDGRIAQTILKNYVKKACGLSNDYDMIAYVSDVLGNERDKIANLSLLVYELAKQNEPCALKIYTNAAKQIARLINTLAKEFPDRVTASYAGGVWNAKDILMDQVKCYLSEHIDFKCPQSNPIYGAYIFAKKNFL